MIGFEPGVPIAFDPVLTVLSLLVAVVGAAPGFALACSRRLKFAPALGGAVVGVAIVIMHYTGMMAYRVQGLVSWDMGYLVASVVISVVFAALALHAAARLDRPGMRYAAGGLLGWPLPACTSPA